MHPIKFEAASTVPKDAEIVIPCLMGEVCRYHPHILGRLLEGDMVRLTVAQEQGEAFCRNSVCFVFARCQEFQHVRRLLGCVDRITGMSSISSQTDTPASVRVSLFANLACLGMEPPEQDCVCVSTSASETVSWINAGWILLCSERFLRGVNVGALLLLRQRTSV